jgi:TPP-dependent pyruvate/acetoin dehydrogenase alpha subunit
VCENNGYASENPIDVSFPTASVTSIGAAFMLPTHSVDGNNVSAVYAVTKAAVDQARAGGGPSFIECSTYRWGVHSQRGAAAPDPRPLDERESAVLRDPIARLREAMLERGEIDAQWVGAVDERVSALLDAAIATASESPFPDPSEALTGLFV